MTEVLAAVSPPSASPAYASPTLRRTPSPKPPVFLDTTAISRPRGYYHDSDTPQSSSPSSPSSEDCSPLHERPPLDITPPSSVNLEPIQADDELYFPQYERSSGAGRDGHGGRAVDAAAGLEADADADADDCVALSPASRSNSSDSTLRTDSLPSPLYKPADDSAAHEEPSRQVDYLSHDWDEQDIWQSWRHIVSNRGKFGERSRLENASWRTWTKAKYQLKTVSPEKLNWYVLGPLPTDIRLKDCDVTWLYGPLQEARASGRGWDNGDNKTNSSEPHSQLSKNNSFLKKPILKKRSVSEVMLAKSLSSSSLVKQAAAAVEAQRSMHMGDRPDRPDKPSLPRSNSEGYSRNHTRKPSNATTVTSLLSSSSASGAHSPCGPGGHGGHAPRKHIRFDTTVEQCIAVDFQPEAPGGGGAARWAGAGAGHGPASSHAGHAGREAYESSSEDDIVMMKSARARRPSYQAPARRDSFTESKGIAMLPSTTLKFHHEQEEVNAEAGNGFLPGGLRPKLYASASQETLRPSRPAANFLLDDDADAGIDWDPASAYEAQGGDDPPSDAPEGLRRTPSGMFMPFDESDDRAATPGVFGRVVDTVNTARDIFSVVLNVGWRS